MRQRPQRLQRLPEQYFGTLLARVTAAAAGEPLVDLGRGNPETGPPQHVVDALRDAAESPVAHGYAPFRGLPALRGAIAERYSSVYGVELDPETEVAVVPGTKTALVELAEALAEAHETVVLPDPWYPDYRSGVALADAELGTVPLDPENGWAPDFSRAPREHVAALYLNYPSNPCGVVVRDGVFEDAIEYALHTGAAVVHDFAYGDLLFDGRTPRSFLAAPGAKEVGVELFSMSKSYGMAGWRLGFVLGNAEIVERLNLLNGRPSEKEHAARIGRTFFAWCVAQQLIELFLEFLLRKIAGDDVAVFAHQKHRRDRLNLVFLGERKFDFVPVFVADQIHPGELVVVEEFS